MNDIFSNRMNGLKPSAIREILKNSTDPDIIAFSAGNPSKLCFPAKDIEKYFSESLEQEWAQGLQYGVTEGYIPLRDALKKRTHEVFDAFDADTDELIITTGAQQVFDLATKILCNEGDTIIAEGPSFVGALSAFRSYGVTVEQVPVHADGWHIDEVEAAVKAAKNLRFVYVIPNFQNPTGLTMTAEVRKELLLLAEKYNFYIIEDNAYGDLRYSGQHQPTIKSMDKTGRVLYLGTMSKILAPGLRVGYVSGNAAIVNKMALAKQFNDVHTPMLNQMVCYRFLTESDVAAHISKSCDLYRDKLNLMLKTLDDNCDGAFGYTRPEGGLFVWCTLPDSIATLDFCKATIAKKLAVVPGSTFYVDTDAEYHSVRINFSCPTDEQIVTGIKIMCDTAKEMMR